MNKPPRRAHLVKEDIDFYLWHRDEIIYHGGVFTKTNHTDGSWLETADSETTQFVSPELKKLLAEKREADKWEEKDNPWSPYYSGPELKPYPREALEEAKRDKCFTENRWIADQLACRGKNCIFDLNVGAGYLEDYRPNCFCVQDFFERIIKDTEVEKEIRAVCGRLKQTVPVRKMLFYFRSVPDMRRDHQSAGAYRLSSDEYRQMYSIVGVPRVSDWRRIYHTEGVRCSVDPQLRHLPQYESDKTFQVRQFVSMQHAVAALLGCWRKKCIFGAVLPTTKADEACMCMSRVAESPFNPCSGFRPYEEFPITKVAPFLERWIKEKTGGVQSG